VSRGVTDTNREAFCATPWPHHEDGEVECQEYDRIHSHPKLNILQHSKEASHLSGPGDDGYEATGTNRSIHPQRETHEELVFRETLIGTCNRGGLRTPLIEDMREAARGSVQTWSTGAIVRHVMLDTNRPSNQNKGCQACHEAVKTRSDSKACARNWQIASLRIERPSLARARSGLRRLRRRTRRFGI
jgi:hypothetical protein